jgi:NADP-dependent 3-hydroxy acid dehydrogenase YdfG
LKILITGASSGIGEAIALEMAHENAIYLTGRNEKRLKKVQEKVNGLGGTAFIGNGDVSKLEDVKRLHKDTISKLGLIDVLIPNAGVGYIKNLEEISDDEYDQMMNINVKGAFYWIREVLPAMKRRNSGQIIVMSSTAGIYKFSRASIYCASKHAVQAMAESLRRELTNTRIKVATLNPGSVDTPWFDKKPNASEINRSTMLSASDVAKSARLIITQSKTSNIDHISLWY